MTLSTLILAVLVSLSGLFLFLIYAELHRIADKFVETDQEQLAEALARQLRVVQADVGDLKITTDSVNAQLKSIRGRDNRAKQQEQKDQELQLSQLLPEVLAQMQSENGQEPAPVLRGR